MSTDSRLGENKCPQCGGPSLASVVCARCSLAGVPSSAGPTSQEYEDAAGDMREVIDNLALLLRRASRKLDPSDPLRTQCVSYLKEIGQAGQPLRPWYAPSSPLNP